MSKETRKAELLRGVREAGVNGIIEWIDQEMTRTRTAAELRNVAAADAPTQLVEHILFQLNQTLFALPITSIAEIERIGQVTPVPHVSEWVLGLTNLRGNILSVIDLPLFLGIGRVPRKPPYLCLIVNSNNRETSTCLIVDQIMGKWKVNRAQIQAPSANMVSTLQPYVTGVAERNGSPLMLLDVDLLLLSPKMQHADQGF